MPESTLLKDKHILICFRVLLNEHLGNLLDHIKSNFCGQVFDGPNSSPSLQWNSVIYLCGNVSEFYHQIRPTHRILIVEELSFNFTDQVDLADLVSVGEIPFNVHNVGVLFPNFFALERDYFAELMGNHKFQSLTESNKTGSSFRKGIYLSKVESLDTYRVKSFNLLRCSTNLDGPTEHFAAVDHMIVMKTNEVAEMFFKDPAPLNHVLAQVYENSLTEGKEKKARIKPHSDKTKDMPRNGLIGFGTFYSEELQTRKQASKDDPFDYVYKNGSVLTKLRFKLKTCVTRADLVKEFAVTLYPNSMFLIPLSTNRLYTHEIVPPSLPVDKIPTRMGYVIRCSKTKALHVDGQTYIREPRNLFTKEPGNLVKLRRPTAKDMDDLRDAYLKENTTDAVVEYGNVYYSMNDGDYKMPM